MRRLAVLAALVVATGLTSSGALAGDDNSAFIRQVSPSGSSLGNTLRIDQTHAEDSTVRGIGANLIGNVPLFLLGSLSANDPLVAQQRGEANNADLTITGYGGELQLFQSAGSSAIWVPNGAITNNTAVLVAGTGALGGVIQYGALNEAGLTLESGAKGLVAQFGTKLTSELYVGAGGTGTIIQSGYNNTTGPDPVTVEGGASLTYIQIGNNLTPSNGLRLFSTVPGNITITQTGW